MESLNKDQLKSLFPQFEQDLLDALEKNGTVKVFQPDELLMRTGQYFKSTVLILDGLVKLYREGEDGGEFFMYHLESGNACALSMICATKNETSAIMAKAITETTVLMVPLHLMDQWMKEYRSWYYFVLETYRSRFEELLETIDQIAFRALDERLEFYLKKNQRAFKTNVLNVSHLEIANELNSSREVISRLLKKMEQKGMVTLYRNQIELLN
ncbi:Crp/Fnr family transcriptional regulator [Fulvivirgaceae bacterium LMO-SS25]